MNRGTIAMLGVVLAAWTGQAASAAEFTAVLAPQARGKLEPFEAFTFNKAEKSFGEKQYEQASAQYDAFFREYPKSAAAPYALFQRARSRHLTGETHECVPLYEEYMDYFPTVIEYAAPALHFIGECHQQNRDLPKATKVWAEIAADADYRFHPISAYSINKLADVSASQGKTAEAMCYYRQVAVDFRSKVPEEARRALDKLLEQLVRVAPNEAELRKLYVEVGGFAHNPQPVAKDANVATDRTYWQQTGARIEAEAKGFNNFQGAERRAFFKYWAGVFQGKFVDWKEFQEQAARFEAESREPKPAAG
jgi:tetratricopeptide (TPR) repeat protein